MKFRNQRHQELFTQAIRRLDRQNFTLMAVVYLFTADTRLWSMTKQSICYSGVDFRPFASVWVINSPRQHGPRRWSKEPSMAEWTFGSMRN